MKITRLWNGFIRWGMALGRQHFIQGRRSAAKVWRSSENASNVYADLDARIDNAIGDLELIDRELSEIALILVEMIDDPKAESARARWMQLTAALAALTTTADELLE